MPKYRVLVAPSNRYKKKTKNSDFFFKNGRENYFLFWFSLQIRILRVRINQKRHSDKVRQNILRN